MDVEERFNLVKRNTEEIIGDNELRELVKSKKSPAVYIGTAITGRPHVAYFVWAIKLADFLRAGFRVKVLLADLHGALDNTPWDVLEKRYKYYEAVIPLLFESIGVSVRNLEIVKGSDFQLDKRYFYDVLRMSTFTSERDCLKAASEVVKMGENPKLSGLIYPIMQALDEEYLDVDVQYGGLDQRKIFVFARENLPKIGYKARVEIMTAIIPGLIGEKMSASVEKSKIDLLDNEEMVVEKVNSAHCVEGDVDNGLLPFLRYVVMVIKGDLNKELIIERDKKYGGNIVFRRYEEIEGAFRNKKLHPLDLKEAVAKEINHLLAPMRKNFGKLSKLAANAYGK